MGLRILVLGDGTNVVSLQFQSRLSGDAQAFVEISSETLDIVPADLMPLDEHASMLAGIGEVLGRIHALLANTGPRRNEPLTEYSFGGVAVDFLNGVVMRDGVIVQLSSTEFRLLRRLIADRGETIPRNKLLREVWGYRATRTRTLDVHVAALRQKLEEVPGKPRYIVTVRGKGYVFLDEDALAGRQGV